MMMKLLVCTLFVLFLVNLSYQQQGPRKFQAAFAATENFVFQGNASSRSFFGQLYYENTWNPNTGAGYDRIRYDIDLRTASIQSVLTELTVFENQFIRYTICKGECAWQDIYAEEPLPRLWINTNQDTPTQTNQNLPGVTPLLNVYQISQTNVVGDNYPNWVQLWAQNSAPYYVYRAILNYNNGVTRTINLNSINENFDSASIFNVPSECPVIDSSCFRLDLFFVFDVSGSVQQSGVDAEFQFMRDISNAFLIDAKHLAVSLVTFSHCNTATLRQAITYDKQFWLNRLNTLSTQVFSDGWTCIVGGIQQAFIAMDTANGARFATDKAMVVLTDGNGNRPCSNTSIEVNPNIACSNWPSSFTPLVPPCSSTISPCDGEFCCQAVHDYQLNLYYANNYATYSPKIYAIGVGSGVSFSTLNLIVQPSPNFVNGQTSVFPVTDFTQLNSIINNLAAAILCDVPGSEICPNDCRPGGFCCAGGCLCTADCSQFATDCEEGICIVNSLGANCANTGADPTRCERADIQCNVFVCSPSVGCQQSPDDSLQCDDRNACTDEICSGGNCVTTTNPNVTQCTDFNPCTENDRCDAVGNCFGTPNDNLDCDDGDLCTTNICNGGVCVVSANKACPDEDTSDCVVGACDPNTGNCGFRGVEEGFECAPPPPQDNCTVFICERFDLDEYNACVARGDTDCGGGVCEQRTRDIDGCGSSSDNVGAIIGGVVAGIAFLAILALCLCICLAILCRNKIPQVIGAVNPFGGDFSVVATPTYVASASSGASGLYDGGL